MAIDFHSENNAGSYASRLADPSWTREIERIANPQGLRIADIGCGGVIYSAAMAAMGASHVTGIDFSAQMVSDARARAQALGIPNVSFEQGEAGRIPLKDGAVDLVLQRALLHHLSSLESAFLEVRRILGENGVLLVQERTMDDVLAPPSVEHFRGWFFDLYPDLIDFESNRRPGAQRVEDALANAGFEMLERHHIAEQRRVYDDVEELRQDLLNRTGRSILHELTDQELATLVDRIVDEVSTGTPPGHPIREIDHWSIWEARVRQG